ncbi:MAG: hypothetical protein WC682_00690 [Parcubacteria group bacterium]
MNKNKVEKAFGRKKAFFPVIHVANEGQALRNVAVAVKAKADGIFLINHTIRAIKLIEIFLIIKKEFPTLWIGINFLDLYNYQAAEQVVKIGADGLWTDNAGVSEVAIERPIIRDELLGKWSGLYFGGVAFKYQEEIRDVATVAKLSLDVVDVVTTSGTQTGLAPQIDKISTIREAIGDNFPMAIASGIAIENVESFLPFCDCFLVATGISFSHTELDAEKTWLLSNLIHNWKL